MANHCALTFGLSVVVFFFIFTVNAHLFCDKKGQQYWEKQHLPCLRLLQVRVKRATIAQFPTYGDLYEGLCSTTGEIPIAIYRTEKRAATFNPVVNPRVSACVTTFVVELYP